jgi:subtilisin family serine protease
MSIILFVVLTTVLDFAEEEAAKFHILLDAVRCPRQPAEIFSRQLSYFNAHIAKGLYANYYKIFAPADLPEIRRYMDSSRIDWIAGEDSAGRRVVINLEAQSAALGNSEQTPAVNAAIVLAIRKGCVVCVAAGNGDRDAGTADDGSPITRGEVPTSLASVKFDP